MLLYGGYIGGAGLDEGAAVTVDGADNVYVAGKTSSTEASFPVTRGPDLTYNGGAFDAFVAKIDARSVVQAPRADVPPTLDGNLAEWQALPALHLDRTTASAIAGSETNPSFADLSADLRTAWSPSGLYFAAAITDDVLVGNNSTQPWGDDSIELSIRVGNATHQFTVAVDGRQADLGNPIASLTVATRTVPGGWTLEVAVPAAALGLAQLSVDQAYPFTFGLWDDDLGTKFGQTHMFWQGSNTYTYQPTWGTLILDSTVYPFPLPATATPTATATATPTLTATATPTSTSTATPSSTPTATRTSTPTSTSTPTPTETPTASATPTATPTATPATGDIAGTVWLDADGDGRRDAGEPGLSGVTVKLLRGNVQTGQAATGDDGAYHFAALLPGAYEVREVQPAWLRWSTTPNEVSVALAASETRIANFGDWNGRQTYLPLILR